MIEYKQLETEKYWFPVEEHDRTIVQKFQREQKISKLLTFGLCAATATLTFLICSGQLGNLEVVQAIERVGHRLPFIGQ